MTGQPEPDAGLTPSQFAATLEFSRHRRTVLLAIVFTDIADSTALRGRLGEAKYELLREEYDREFSEIVSAAGAGFIVKGTGDGALVVFDEPSIAVERSLEVQDRLGVHPYFRLRIGIDLGQVAVRTSFGLKSDVFGRSVNRAARILALAEPGHVLTSFTLYDCAVGWLDREKVAWHYHGKHLLKGIEEEVAVHETFDRRIGRPQTLTAADHLVQHDLDMAPKFSRRRGKVIYGSLEQADWLVERSRALANFQLPELESAFIEAGVSLDDVGKRIKAEAETLRQATPLPPSLLWIDDWPEGNRLIIQILQDAGVEVLINKFEPQERNYLIAIAAIGSDRGALSVLARLSDAQDGRTLRIVYGPASILAPLEHDLAAQQLSLATSGAITLLRSIEAYLASLRLAIPVTFEPEPWGGNQPESAGITWSSRLRALLGLK